MEIHGIIFPLIDFHPQFGEFRFQILLPLLQSFLHLPAAVAMVEFSNTSRLRSTSASSSEKISIMVISDCGIFANWSCVRMMQSQLLFLILANTSFSGWQA